MTLAVRELALPPDGSSGAPGRLVVAFNSPNPPPFFVLRVSSADGVVVAEDVTVAVHGSGPTDTAALEDFLEAARTHLDVLESQEQLSPRLRQKRDYLRERLPA